MDVCQRLARCRAKFQEIADSGADLSVQYVVRKHWHVVPRNASQATAEIVAALAAVAAAFLKPKGGADDWWWHVARLPGSTPRHPYEIVEAARYSADALQALELSIERAERPDVRSPNSPPQVASSR